MKYLISVGLVLSLILIVKCTSSSGMQNGFNQLASDPEWKPDQIMKALQIKQGWNIGDLGAGGGYYTYRFAEATGDEGTVFAADINKDYLVNIKKTSTDNKIANIKTIKCSEDNSNFEDNSLDLLFCRNTFHHFSNKGHYLKRLIPKLKKDGKIALIDYKEDASFWLMWHSVSESEILDAIDEAGLIVEAKHDFLEKQYFYILSVKSDAE